MESIKTTVAKLAGAVNLDREYGKLLDKVSADPRLETWRSRVPEDMFYRGLPKFVEYLDGQDHCDNCPGLARCPNLLRGYQPVLTADKGAIEIVYQPCALKVKADREKRQAALIHSLYVPKKALNATFRSIDKAELGRQDALEAAGRFVQHYLQNPETTKGLYLHGPFGVGKSHIMGAILNALAERKGVESMMVYTPDFFRELKGSIQDQSIDDKLDYIKTVPVLVLDDIGAETMTPWIRDDILGSVLQSRMASGLPTLYTSNYDYDELENHLAYSNKSGTELLKAKRIMERIRHYTEPVAVTGTNRRGKD